MNSDAKEFVGVLVFFFGAAAFIFAVGFAGIVAIPVGLGAGIFYYFYKRANRENEEDDLDDIYRKAKAKSPMSLVEFSCAFGNAVPDNLLTDVAEGLYKLEGFTSVPPPPSVKTPIEVGRYKDKMARYVNQSDKGFLEAVVERLKPHYQEPATSMFEAYRSLTNMEVQALCHSFTTSEFFKTVEKTFDKNYTEQGGPPEKYKGNNVGWDYLKDTPLLDLEFVPIPVNLNNRMEHMHILGGTGSGKTQLIQFLISKDLEEDCCVIVIDNQGQMIPKLARLGVDTQYISPQYPLALNIFDMPRSHTTTPLLQYVLSGIMNAPLTPKQELIFQFGVSLILSLKGNINTFQQLLDGARFDLSNVDDTTKIFFETQFYSKQFEQTRQEISWRIWSLLKNPTLRDMFGATTNRCALELDRKLILIDCDVDLLLDYTSMFGRFFIAQLLHAAQHRFKGSHKPVYVYIDEAYYYLDDNVTSMLETARKAKMGLILSHQLLGQLATPKIASHIMSLTSTKFAAQLSPADASTMSQAMRIDAKYIHDVPDIHFALWQKGEETCTIEVPVGVIEEMATHEVDEDEIKKRYCRQKQVAHDPSPEPIYEAPEVKQSKPVAAKPISKKPQPFMAQPSLTITPGSSQISHTITPVVSQPTSLPQPIAAAPKRERTGTYAKKKKKTTQQQPVDTQPLGDVEDSGEW